MEGGARQTPAVSTSGRHKPRPAGDRRIGRIRMEEWLKMDLTAIYEKTPKGQEEMALRTYKIAARERSVLILVDGKSRAQDIVAKARHFGDAEQYLQALIRDGFIEPVGGTKPQDATTPSEKPFRPDADTATPPPAATPARSAGSVSSARSLPETKLFACDYLIRVMGAYADTMTGAIEACNDRAQLLPLLEKYRDMIRGGISQRRAEEFWNGVLARLP